MKAALRVETLESRITPTALPTDLENQFLRILNEARSNPPAYGRTIGLNLDNVAAAPPLVMDTRLVESARLHSQDMLGRNYVGHYSPENLGPGDREVRAGYHWQTYEESISWGQTNPAESLKGLIIDTFDTSLGHRIHLLAMSALARQQTDVGIGIATGGVFGHYYTIDTGSGDSNPATQLPLPGGTPAPVSPDASQQFAVGLYTSVLQRVITEAEKPQWRGRTLNDVAGVIVSSAEGRMQQARNLVTTYYTTFLHRQPDPYGLTYWSNFLYSAGDARVFEVTCVTNAGGAYEKAHPDAEGWVRSLYQDFMGRAALTLEVNFWTPILKNHSRVEVARWFAASLEHRHHADTVWLQEEFQLINQRAPSAVEIAVWDTTLLVRSRESVIFSLVMADEYRRRLGI